VALMSRKVIEKDIISLRIEARKLGPRQKGVPREVRLHPLNLGGGQGGCHLIVDLGVLTIRLAKSTIQHHGSMVTACLPL
jgi:hypothetical protein